MVVECWGVHLPAEDAGFKSDGVRIVLYGTPSKAFTKSVHSQSSLYTGRQHILAIPGWDIQGAFHELEYVTWTSCIVTYILFGMA